MRTIAIVIVGKFGEHGLKVALIHHDHVVQTLCPNGPHDPLADGVRLRRPWRRSYARNAQIGQSFVEVATVIRVSIVDQVRRLPAERGRLQHLAPDPGSGRAGGDVEMHPFPPIMAEQEEYIEDAVAHRLDHEEIRSPDATELIG